MHSRASMKREKKIETIRRSLYFDVEQLILRPITYAREVLSRKKITVSPRKKKENNRIALNARNKRYLDGRSSNNEEEDDKKALHDFTIS
jgi:hypothetical protein